MSAIQGGFAVNYPHLLNEVAVHLAYIIGHALEKELQTVEVSQEAEEAWVQTIIGAGGPGMQIGGPGCTPGYYNNEGKPSPLAKYGAPYNRGAIKFWQVLEQWRKDGTFEGLEMGG